jgi:parallel beta-helix repeat protein
VSLIGESKFSTIIDGQALGSVINITASNVTVTGFTARNSKFGYGGIRVYQSNGDNVSGNIVKNNYDGILFYSSNGSTVSDNNAQSNEYGIHLYGSSEVNVSGNAASGNMNGIHLDVSSNNTVIDNDASSNSGNGIYLYGSSNNTVLGNDLFSNLGGGIGVQYSGNNTVLSNIASRNGYGVYFYGSDGNILGDDVVSFNNESGMLLFGSAENTVTSSDISNNTFGIWFINSDGNGVSGNNVSSNGQFGIRLWNSSSNIFFHNNFVGNAVQNVEQPTNTSLFNLWDYDGEGNFWGDYNSANIGLNGIGYKPHIVDDRSYLGVYSKDSSPLMGPYSQFTAVVANQSYVVTFVSNSTISRFQNDHSPDNASLVSFEANGSEGNGFCRIAMPNVLIPPPYVVMVNNASLQYIVVRSNGTHTWLYFTYQLPAYEVTIATVAPIVPPEATIWSQWWFWGIFGLALALVVLGGFSIRYRKKVAEQTKILQAYSPFVIGEALFKADIERRGVRIKEFEEKYDVKIQPRSTLEDVIRSMEAKEKEDKT